MKKLMTVKEAAEVYGLRPRKVSDMCHAKGQRFAFQTVKGGKLMIDPEGFERHLKMFFAWNGERT